MLVRIFKVITTIAIIMTLFLVVKKRELVIKNTDSNNQSSSQLVTKVQELAKEVHRVSDTSKPISPSVAPSESETSTTEQTYVPLREGASDTDEDYRPKISPCVKTMQYKIGSFDTRFGLTREQFIQKIDDAGDLWGAVVNKKLFSYSPQGTLTINLIYDERQARTEEVNNLALEIENSKAAAESIRLVYEQEKEMYVTDGEQLTKDNENFQLRYKAYNEKVATYNASGGAQKIEYEAMMSELAGLKKESELLEARRMNLLSLMESINAKIRRYNEFVAYINTLIKQSNSLGAKKFTEGRFDPNNNTIDIFQYNDTNKLLRVMAHELGHVLGINHNKNVASIMYSMNSATTTELSREDREALQEVCPYQ